MTSRSDRSELSNLARKLEATSRHVQNLVPPPGLMPFDALALVERWLACASSDLWCAGSEIESMLRTEGADDVVAS
jgi:hypothetical protein